MHFDQVQKKKLVKDCFTVVGADSLSFNLWVMIGVKSTEKQTL